MSDSEIIELPGTIYFDRSNNLVAVVMDSNPKKKFTVNSFKERVPCGTSTATDLERNPNQGNPKKMKSIVRDLNRLPDETSTDGETSTSGDDKEKSGRVCVWRQWRTAPGHVEKFIVSASLNSTYIEIGRRAGEYTIYAVVSDFEANEFQRGEGIWSEIEP
ncbi:hypothetical protein FRC08_006283 [Ceratobasidium sp. 394]|nr:hypothetical protein FRC08_006283 [Ceratobasidium sp. 394]